MKKEEFLKNLADALELDANEINLNSPLQLSSLMRLSLMSFIDEKFGVRVRANELKDLDNVEKIVTLIGKNKLE